MTTRHVVVGVDGSVVAVRALDEAAAEAVRRGAGLEIVHAVPDLDEAGPVLASAATRVRRRHPGLPLSTTPVAGDAAEALVCRGRNAALTVVGSRGLPGFAGLLLGSVSLRVAARTRSPLLVVRGDHVLPQPGAGPGEVLLGIESDTDTDAAAYAFEEAARRGSPLRVLHAWTYRHLAPAGLVPMPTSRVQDDIDLRSRTESAVPGHVVATLRCRHPGVPVHTLSVRSGPAHALLEATRAAGVIVVAAHRRPGRLGPQLGPVTSALLRHSHCPVVLVPVAPEIVPSW
ncbi:universal stress protein [Streptomyces sp. H10-C2]|uniref:universal stress protein n=1 Tax=unclassified Streptomyces TaxID=2593676 RepID=UPI0024B8C7EE|nr:MULTISPECIES: universal stress protein [unclassified Streptomyces]MDJ0344729.1 universal stress protein [Streptomyces sp. PH10-H1]MDJ0371219.1 universal stress protein [Streptomyces sp. H10-C2]